MVTHRATMLEKHSVFGGEAPPRSFPPNRVKKRAIKAEDPMSHRIIEKRRRDRMNNCLADLSRLIPPEYLKKGRGRIEKTEIIEMAIKHMRHLQSIIASSRFNENSDNSVPSPPAATVLPREPASFPGEQPIIIEHYRLGYLECLSEAMHFLVEVQGYFAGDSLCVQMINHLHKHCDKILKGNSFSFPKKHAEVSSSDSSASPANGTFNNSPPLGLSNSTGSTSDDNQPGLNLEAVKQFEMVTRGLQAGRRSPRYGDPLYPKGSEGPYHRFVDREGVDADNRSESEQQLSFPLKLKSLEVRKEEGKSCGNGYEAGLPGRNYPMGHGIYGEENSNLENVSLKEESGNGASQLREMLTSPPAHQGRLVSEPKGNASPLSSVSCCEFSPCQPKAPKPLKESGEGGPDFPEVAPDSHHMMYKFKNNIKQRFSKEKREHSECGADSGAKKQKPNEEYLKQADPLIRERLNLLDRTETEEERAFRLNPELESRRRSRYPSESEVPDGDISNRLSFGHKSLEKGKKWEETMATFPYQGSGKLWGPSTAPVPFFGPQAPHGGKPLGRAVAEFPSSLNSCMSGAAAESGPGIPIFALHAKGSFYIPLTLDHATLSPFLTILGITKTDEGVEEKAVLHPVTISVNFQSHLVR